MTVASSLTAVKACPSPSERNTARRLVSSRRTASQRPYVGEPTLTSTITSRTAPLTHVTYFACPGGTLAKWTPRTTPRRDTEQLACAISGRYPSDPDSSPARNHSRK
jgi:hypothetical protein